MDIGARVREVREMIGMKAQDLGTEIGLDPSAISNIERGKRSVKGDELAAIAKTLGVSVLALLDGNSLLARLPVSPRTSNGVMLKGEVLERITGIAELHEILAEWESETLNYSFPAVDTNEWLDQAPSLANWAREKLEYSPTGSNHFFDLVGAIENKLGIDVLVESRADEDFSGASLTDVEYSLIYVNAEQPITRALFTLAHELGHVLAQDGSFVIDQDLVANSDNERFANAFAAELLLPEQGIRSLITSENLDALALCSLLALYGTSYETLIYRLHNLRIIDAVGRDKLRKIGLRGLMSQINDGDLEAKLFARMKRYPTRHAPVPLTKRAFTGYKMGVISSRPLASLLGVSPEVVTATMELDAAAELEDAVVSNGLNSDSASDLYGGSPVEEVE